jgi:hypothetical protein
MPNQHRQHKKEDYALIRNQLSQEQVMAVFYIVFIMLSLAMVFLAYIICTI